MVTKVSGLNAGELPFRELKVRVHQLCSSVISASFPGSRVRYEYEDLKGGAFNRIVAVKTVRSRTMYEPSVNEDYILRLPNDGMDGMGQQAATLDFILKRTRIPVPYTVLYKDNCSNYLGSPFILQLRVPGIPLNDVFDDMTLEQRCSLAREIASIYVQLDSLRSPVAGQIDYGKYYGLYNYDKHFQIVPLPTAAVEHWDEYAAEMGNLEFARRIAEYGDTGVAPKFRATDTYRFLLERYADIAKADPEHPILYWTKEFTAMARGLVEHYGLLGEDYFTFWHPDLEPRNIRVMPRKDGTPGYTISGVFDWDDAMFAPRTLSMKAPVWLWRDYETKDDEFFGDEPYLSSYEAGNEMHTIRHAFEAAVLEGGLKDYKEMAYRRIQQLARKLCRISLLNLDPEEDPGLWKVTAAMIEEWKAIRSDA